MSIIIESSEQDEKKCAVESKMISIYIMLRSDHVSNSMLFFYLIKGYMRMCYKRIYPKVMGHT